MILIPTTFVKLTTSNMYINLDLVCGKFILQNWLCIGYVLKTCLFFVCVWFFFQNFLKSECHYVRICL